MAARVLLAIGREDIRSQATATLAELGDDVELVGVAETSGDLLLALEANPDIDLVFIDDQIGSLPYLALTREVITRSPDLGVVLLVSETDANALQSAMDAGARAVMDSPPSLGELATRVPLILQWQRQVRSLSSNLGGAMADAGRMIVFAGAKGGVGTSTIAVHIALLAAASNPERRVCLIDLDLQQRGLRQVIDLPSHRTVSDLVSIADNLTGRNLDEATILHRSGLRILVAPEHGEQAEDVDGHVARQILAAAKGHYDLTVVDAGSVVTEASAVGMEFADDLFIVTTPDIAALRAAQDKHDLLSRLQVGKEAGAELLFNKVSSRNEVQPEFGARMATSGVCRVSLPEDWRRIEPAANALNPTELEDGPFRKSVLALGRELRLAIATNHVPTTPAPPEPARSRGGKKRRSRRDDSGQVTIEATVGIVVAVMILLVLMQTAMMALGLVVSRRAADQAALVGSRGGTPDQAAASAIARSPGFFKVRVNQVSGSSYRAVVKAPTIVPWINGEVQSTASAAMEN